MSASTIFRALAQSRRSCRRFQNDRDIPPEILNDILESTLRSPSSFNLQPTQIILVQDASLKEQLSQEAMLGPGNQFRTQDASALAVFLTDLEPTQRIQRVCDLEKPVRHPNYLANLPLVPSFLIGQGHLATLLKQASTNFLRNVQAMPVVEDVQAWGYKNTSLMAQSLVLAATSHDLATCIMEGYDPTRVQEILEVPDRYAIPLMVALGYDYDEALLESRTPRLPIHEVVFQETFGRPWQVTAEDDEAGNESDGTSRP